MLRHGPKEGHAEVMSDRGSPRLRLAGGYIRLASRVELRLVLGPSAETLAETSSPSNRLERTPPRLKPLRGGALTSRALVEAAVVLVLPICRIGLQTSIESRRSGLTGGAAEPY